MGSQPIASGGSCGDRPGCASAVTEAVTSRPKLNTPPSRRSRPLTSRNSSAPLDLNVGREPWLLEALENAARLPGSARRRLAVDRIHVQLDREAAYVGSLAAARLDRYESAVGPTLAHLDLMRILPEVDHRTQRRDP